MIPKIIHQTNNTISLTKDLQRWHDTCKKLHPNWQFRFWTDQENRSIVKQYFPQYLAAYDALPYSIMRVDMVRCVYMYVFGGVYMDLDYELLKPLDPIILANDLVLPLSREIHFKKSYKNGVVIGNCIFASAPGHPFWKDVLDCFFQNPPLEKFSNKHKIVHLSGPDFLTDVYFSNPDKYNAYLPEKKLFHPDLNFARAHLKELVENKECFGIHHCKGSWLKKNNTFSNQLERVKTWTKRKVLNLFLSYVV